MVLFMEDSKKDIWRKILEFIARVIEIAISVFFGVKLTGLI